MAGFRQGRRALVIVGLIVGLAGLGCDALNQPDETSGTMVLLFENDTVFVALPSGEISSGPIVISDTVTFGASFLASDGTADEGIIEPQYRLDAASADTNLVTVVRNTAFTHTLQRRAPGSTEISIGLYDNDLPGYVFDFNIPITIN